jgi:hypothetical protein
LLRLSVLLLSSAAPSAQNQLTSGACSEEPVPYSGQGLHHRLIGGAAQGLRLKREYALQMGVGDDVSRAVHANEGSLNWVQGKLARPTGSTDCKSFSEVTIRYNFI